MIAGGVSTGDPTTGVPSQFGFEVPQGSPEELEAAARACSRWGAALTARAGSLRAGAKTASGDWSGAAHSAFTAVAGHVIGVCGSLGGVVDNAARSLSSFAQELEIAQQTTRQALQQCETYHQQATTSQQEAAAHARTAQTLSTQAATAIHPQQAVELNHQLSIVQGQQTAAERAANDAVNELQTAQRRGTQAWTDYQHQAQATARTLQGLAAQIQKVERLPGGGAAALSGMAATASGGAVGFWPIFNGIAGSEASDASIGLAEGILRRYRNSDLVLPITKQASRQLEHLSGEVGEGADPFATLPNGLLVPRGSSGDPLVGQIESMTSGDGYNTPGEGFFVPGEDDLEAAAPGWANIGGRALGGLGVGLTLYSTGADQWEYDSSHHPGWSTTHKVIDTTQSTAVVGGTTVAGALAGAEVGAEGGAAAGAAVGSVVPIVGTAAGGVVGGVVGGVAGGIAGGGVGRAVGHGLEDVGHDVGHEASHIWHSVF